jgi:hypothetical protein
MLSNIIMNKINNSKKRENRKTLLAMFEFSNLQDAKEGLGMNKKKAGDVYEQLRLNYNEQIDEIRKNKRKAKYQEKKEFNKILDKVKAFNSNAKSLTFTDMTPSKLKAILSSLDLTKRVILEVDGKYYALTPDNVKEMYKNIDEFWVTTESDYGTNYNADIVLKIKNVKSITLSIPKWLGKNKNEGAFFKYYHVTKLDLDQFGIFKEKQEKYNENCFVQALITLGIDDEIIKGIRNIICSKYLPTNKLSQIAEKYNLYFRIKILDKHKDTINFGRKCNKEVLLGLIDQHYFAIAPVEITTYALKNYFELKDVENYHQIFKKN